MQCWRFIRFATLAMVLLGAPAWVLAQEPAKKDAAPAAAPTAAAEKAQSPADAITKKARRHSQGSAAADPTDGAAAAAPAPAAQGKEEFKFFAF